MSFILDALKKADSERSLGELPGIHSRALPGAGPRLASPFLPRRSTWLLVAAPIVALAVWSGMRFMPDTDGSRTPVQLTSSAPVNPATAAPAPALALAPTSALGATATPAASSSPKVVNDIPVPPPLPAPAPPASKPVASAAVTGVRSAGAGERSKKEVQAAAVPADKAANRASDKPIEPAAAANLITDLPPNLQKEIPKLAIAGSIYSVNPADRMLLIDKRMLHEGDEISPGLVLETVMPKAATLRYKGHAFRVVF